jgi:hypothetical protein
VRVDDTGLDIPIIRITPQRDRKGPCPSRLDLISVALKGVEPMTLEANSYQFVKKMKHWSELIVLVNSRVG